jgi:uncharacterized peroxidase-related enzyme
MWISSISEDEAEGPLRESYERQARALGHPTDLTRAGSLYPQLVAARLDLYAATERCPSSLTAHQRNLISFVTSALNGTPHCMSQVTIKLRETGLDDDEIAALATDPAAVELAPADRAVVDYAAKLTRHPATMSRADVEALRNVGFDDLAILDINAQCAHLNYVNRVANGLGIDTIVDPDFPAYAAIPDSGLPPTVTTG